MPAPLNLRSVHSYRTPIARPSDSCWILYRPALRVTLPPAPSRHLLWGGGADDLPATVALDCSSVEHALPETDWVLCIDFGTAKSKAFAATQSEDPEFLELPIGTADNDPDKSIYAVTSSVWIEDDGVMFVGSEAVRRGQRYQGASHTRRRLDSLKQEISQVLPHGDAEAYVLGEDVNPTNVSLTIEDAISFFLAYVTDLATSELETRIKTRYVRRRFTLPWWDVAQRKWGAALIGRSLARAQILADTFHGKWAQGVPVAVAKAAITQASQHDEKAAALLDTVEAHDRWSARESGGVLEPLAAASSRVWSDAATRGLVLVIDVGAGTTDVTLFWTMQNVKAAGSFGNFAFPVHPCGTAVKQAGDTLDSLLVQELLNKAHLGADPALRDRASKYLYLEGVRGLKERLFENEIVTTTLVNGESVTLELDEFLRTAGVARFSVQVKEAITKLLSQAPASLAAPADGRITLVLTGGGCRLPMVRELTNEVWRIGDKTLRSRLADALPQFVKDEFDANFQQVYPQLAVAMGGAMPILLDERQVLTEWLGEERSRASVERY